MKYIENIENIENCVYNSELLELLNQNTKYSINKASKIVLYIKDEDFLKFLFESDHYHNKIVDLTLTCDIFDITSYSFLFFKIACQYVVNKQQYLTALLYRIVLSFIYDCPGHFTLNQINEITFLIKDYTLAINIAKQIYDEVYLRISVKTHNNFKLQLKDFKNKCIFLRAMEKIINDEY